MSGYIYIYIYIHIYIYIYIYLDVNKGLGLYGLGVYGLGLRGLIGGQVRAKANSECHHRPPHVVYQKPQSLSPINPISPIHPINLINPMNPISPKPLPTRLPKPDFGASSGPRTS